MRGMQEHRSLRDSSRTPLEVPLHTAIWGSELQAQRMLKVVTVVVIPYPALQRRIEQSGSLAVAARTNLQQNMSTGEMWRTRYRL